MRSLLHNLKMATKLMIAPSALIIFMIILSILAFSGLSLQKNAIEDIFHNRFQGFQESAEIIKEISTIHGNLYRITSWSNESFTMENKQKKIDDLIKWQTNTLTQNAGRFQSFLKKTNLLPEEKKIYQKASEQFNDYQKKATALMDMVTTDLNAVVAFMFSADDSYQQLDQVLSELASLEKKLSKEKYESSVSNFNFVLTGFIAVLIVSIILSLLISVITARLITAPLKETVDVVKSIADGDLTRSLESDSRDEVGDLTRSVDAMRTNMSEAVGNAVAISQMLSEAASDQASSIEETSASLDETASMTRRNAENTQQANKMMMESRSSTEKASVSMTDLTKSMKEIAQASEQAQKIVKNIDEIAFQTNLLALNAAVEAARAGEAGAGFAVVADEVRNLSMRATEAAKNTSTLIEDIVKKVNTGEKLANGTNQVFSEVTGSSAKVVSLMEEVALASNEQAQGIEQINKAIAGMSKSTQQNAANAEELAAIMAIFKTEGRQTNKVTSAPKNRKLISGANVS